eukprot:707817-Ditylum_brightwellii.AAC.1
MESPTKSPSSKSLLTDYAVETWQDKANLLENVYTSVGSKDPRVDSLGKINFCLAHQFNTYAKEEPAPKGSTPSHFNSSPSSSNNYMEPPSEMIPSATSLSLSSSSSYTQSNIAKVEQTHFKHPSASAGHAATMIAHYNYT